MAKKQKLQKKNVPAAPVNNPVKNNPVSKTFVIIAISVALVLVVGIFLLLNPNIINFESTGKATLLPPTKSQLCGTSSCGAVSDGYGNYVDCGLCSLGYVCVASQTGGKELLTVGTCVPGFVMSTKMPQPDQDVLQGVNQALTSVECGKTTPLEICKMTKLAGLINALVSWYNDPSNQ